MTSRWDLIEQANRAHVQYPQYEGHWDNWQAAVVTRQIRTKGGIRFEAGDRVLVNTRPVGTAYPDRTCWAAAGLSMPGYVTAYSWRGEVDCSVPVKAVDVLPMRLCVECGEEQGSPWWTKACMV